jgi:hypothetical protein
VNGTTATVIGEMPPGAARCQQPCCEALGAGAARRCTFREVETTYIQIGSGGGDQDPRLMTVTLGLSATKACWRTSQEIGAGSSQRGDGGHT